MTSSSAASRTAGSTPCSPICIDRSWCSFSNPHDPARPQQPPLASSTSQPIRFSSDVSLSMPPVAFS